MKLASYLHASKHNARGGENPRVMPTHSKFNQMVISHRIRSFELLKAAFKNGLKSLLENQQMAPPRDQSGEYTVSSQNMDLENCFNTNNHLFYL